MVIQKIASFKRLIEKSVTMRRLLIVGTVPFNNQSTSRAFDSYFHGWNKDCIAQIFSNSKNPVKGHCGTLYQITDRRMLNRWQGKRIETGRIFYYDELEYDINKQEDCTTGAVKVLKKYGELNKTSLTHLARKILWRKRFWCTEKLNQWLDAFDPECVFLSFSDDFFIPEIAMYVADRYQIPIISSIGDDYYFNYKFTLNPLYHLYKLNYRKTIRKVFEHEGSAIYIGDKIRDKYNSEFNLEGETVYLTSSIQKRDFRPINVNEPQICYFGNLHIGRNKSIVDIADEIRKINEHYMIDVYSGETDISLTGMLEKHSNIRFHGTIPYTEVQKKTAECDILLVVEGFKKKDVDISRYSLSTKVADSLSAGVQVLAYGSLECGAIEYLKQVDCATVCTHKNDIKNYVEQLIFDVEKQRRLYKKSAEIVERNHRLKKSIIGFQNIVEREVIKNERRKSE